MNQTLERFHDHCRVYYAVPRDRHNMAGRARAYRALLNRHDAEILLCHVSQISRVLTRAEMQYVRGKAAESLRRVSEPRDSREA